MTVIVTARGSNVTNAEKKHATEKGEKLGRFFNGITKLEMILSTDGPEKKAEVILHIVNTSPIISHAEHESMTAAIDGVVDRAEKRLLKYKDKLRDHHRGETVVPVAEEEPTESLESYQEIVDEREFPK